MDLPQHEAPFPARSSGASATRRCPMTRRSPRWRRGSRRSAPARAPELVWLLEHPPLYTAGTSAHAADLLEPGRLPVFTDRPRRPVHLSRAGPARGLCDARPDAGAARDVRCHVWRLEEWMIRGAGAVRRRRRAARGPGRRLGRAARRREDKIAAIGVRVRHWVTYHGVALNVDPDLDALPRHRAVRHRRARRHLARRARHHAASE